MVGIPSSSGSASPSSWSSKSGGEGSMTISSLWIGCCSPGLQRPPKSRSLKRRSDRAAHPSTQQRLLPCTGHLRLGTYRNPRSHQSCHRKMRGTSCRHRCHCRQQTLQCLLNVQFEVVSIVAVRSQRCGTERAPPSETSPPPYWLK